MIRKQIAVLFLALSAAAGFAQTLNKAGIATQFNQWRAYGTTNLSAGSNPLTPISPCMTSAGGFNFPVLTASTPIKIYDPGNPTIDEIITPTVIVVGSTCTATFTTTNAHPQPWYIGSGSFGLQEAINNTAQTGVINQLTVDAPWHQAGGGANTIYAAAGSPLVGIEDISIEPDVTWRWNGTHYQSNFAINGVGVPTITAGAAAGTAPTVANTVIASNGNVMTALVTTGTATTTGTLFTETVGTAAVGGNLNCVVQNVGANIPPALTVVGTSNVLATVSVTVAPAISTAYIIQLECN